MPIHLGYKRRNQEKLEARRFAALARLVQGEPCASVARSFGVCVQSVQRWARCHRSGGDAGLLRRPKRGPRPKLAPEELERLRKLLEQGPIIHGFDTPVWTTERVTHLIWRHFRIRYSPFHVKRTLLPRLDWKWHKHTWLPANGVAKSMRDRLRT